MLHMSANSWPFPTMPSWNHCNDEYLFWFEYWTLIRDCLMGEIMIKRRGPRYLPKLTTQTDEEYRAFLSRAVFYNATARTVNGLVGAVHIREPIVTGLPDDVSLDKVTRDGQSFLSFAKSVTREVVALGRYGVLIDAPEDGGEPYLAGYVAEDIVDWSTRRVMGRDTLDRVVLRETTREGSGLDTKAVTRYRVLFLDEGGVYRQRIYDEDADLRTGPYVEITPLRAGRLLTHIPFLFFSPYDFRSDVDKPPMLDIALMNLSHYQSYAELEHGRFYAAVPVWAVYLAGGADEGADFKVGPNVIWQLGQNDKVELHEFNGGSLKFLENALVTKEQQIAALGGKLGTQPRGTAAESSESVALRERGEASFLQSMISIMGDGMTMLLRELCAWRGAPSEEVHVKFSTEAVEMYLGPRELAAIERLYKTGLLPVEVIYAVFRDANILPVDMSMDEFIALLPTVTPPTEQQIIATEEKLKAEKKYKPKPEPKVVPQGQVNPGKAPAKVS